jgi:hypothetical protein
MKRCNIESGCLRVCQQDVKTKLGAAIKHDLTTRSSQKFYAQDFCVWNLGKV